MTRAPLEADAWKWGFWFRVFGYGIHVRRIESHDPMFSERYGFTTAYYVFGLRLKFLTPER